MIKAFYSRTLLFVVTALIASLLSCVMSSDEDNQPVPPAGFDPFPFKSIANWWSYTETNGNPLKIAVTDTLTDDLDIYYKVRFEEKSVDTTDDWFKQLPQAITFSPTLAGTYSIFLPLNYSSGSTGTFNTSTGKVTYAYSESAVIGSKTYYRVMRLTYQTPVLHGFGEIVFADSVGIVAMIDNSGRLDVTYTLDSASVYGRVLSF